MSPTSARQHQSITIDLVLCSVRNGQLQLLVTKGAHRAPSLPFTWNAPRVPVEHAARTLARELTGHSGVWVVQGPALTDVGHPADSVLSIPFVGIVAPVDVRDADAHWSPLDVSHALKKRQRVMAEQALNVLRLHMDRVPVAFHLLPTAFTLRELQDTYELLIGRKLHKASFRRALSAASLVVPIKEWRIEGRGRPAQLFRYAPRKHRPGHRIVQFDQLGR